MAQGVQAGDLADKSILIVDDEDVDVVFLRRAFRSVAPDLKIADTTDSASAIDLVSRVKPDLVILDLKMAGATGLDILKALRSNPDNDTRPILILSNSSSREDVQACLEARANAYSVKPKSLTDYRAYANAVVAFWLGSSLANI